MKCTKRVLLLLLGGLVTASTALAEIPDGSVIIGKKAYQLDYANDLKNVDEITEAINESNRIFIKSGNEWYNNAGETWDKLTSLPRMIYKDAEGEIFQYRKQNGEEIIGAVNVIGLNRKKEISIVFNQDLYKEWYENRANILINGKILDKKDVITFNEKTFELKIILAEEIDTNQEIIVSGKKVVNSFSQEIIKEFSRRIIVVDSVKKFNELLKDGFKGDISLTKDSMELALKNFKGNIFVQADNIKLNNYKYNGIIALGTNCEKIEITDSEFKGLSSTGKSRVEMINTKMKQVNDIEQQISFFIDKNSEIGELVAVKPLEDKPVNAGGSYYGPTYSRIEINSLDLENYREFAINIDGDFDETQLDEIKKNFEVHINGKAEKFEVTVMDNKLKFRLDSEYIMNGEDVVPSFRIKKDDKVKVEYTKGQKNGLKISSKIVDSFVYENTFTNQLSSLDNAKLEIKNEGFYGEIDNEEKEIIIFEEKSTLDILESMKTANGVEIDSYEKLISPYVVLVAKDGTTKTYNIVKNVPTLKFNSQEDLNIDAGDTETLRIIKSDNVQVSYEISTDNIQIDGNQESVEVNGVRPGNGILRVYGQVIRNDKTIVKDRTIQLTKSIHVNEIFVSSIVMDKKMKIEVGNKEQLVPTIYPGNTTNKELEWISSNNDVVMVSEDGVVTAINPGTALVKVITSNGLSASCEVTVVNRTEDIYVSKINGYVEIRIHDVKATERSMILKIINKENANLEHLSEYELKEGINVIRLKLENGVYNGEINIVDSRRLSIKTFNLSN